MLSDAEISFRTKQYLYHLKAQPSLRMHVLTAQQKLLQLQIQVKPADMSKEDWERTKLTPLEVMKWMRKKVRQQNKRPPSRVPKKLSHAEINDIIVRHKPHYGTYAKMINRKRAQYQLQHMPFEKMERVAALDKFLYEFKLVECSNGMQSMYSAAAPIRLNDKQFNDLGYAFQKRYSILNWQQGGGKSVAGMAWVNLVKPLVKHVFITAPSLAVQLTWKVRLQNYGYDFIVIDKWWKFDHIQPGQIVVMSFDMVRILQRHLKRFIKHSAYNIALLVDESDELANMTSARTRAMLNCFRRGKYKLLTTGTTTRNNIGELYPQLELLFNNSINMLCWSPQIHRPDKDGAIQVVANKQLGKPFPAVSGHTLFKWCHAPKKVTMFSVKAETKELYNEDRLNDILNRTVITRTFDDIVGKRIYQIKSHQVLQNDAERQLYNIIFTEFEQIVHLYFNATGDDRMEALLRIIRQITLLIKSTSVPHLLDHYGSDQKPEKFYKINDLVTNWYDEKVAIGTITVAAAQEYNRFLKAQHPDRKIFYVDGSKSFKQRERIIEGFQKTVNGVLISTQQSLKSSVDIETVNKCIIESMQWNIPKMSQYFFRFIRYSSQQEKEIHMVTYSDTIEQNILALVMNKEKMNEFAKTGEVKARDKIMQEYDVDTSILAQLVTKDSAGNLQWSRA